MEADGEQEIALGDGHSSIGWELQVSNRQAFFNVDSTLRVM